MDILCSCSYSSQLQTSSLLASGLNASTLLFIRRNTTNLHLERSAALAGLENTLFHSIPSMDGAVVLLSQKYKPDPTKCGYLSHPVLVSPVAQERKEVPRPEGSRLRRQPDAA